VVHEWALAEAILATLSRSAGGRPPRAVRVLLGELQNVDAEVLRFALEELKRGTALEGVEFILEVEPAEFECAVCRARWTLRDVEVGSGEREAIHFVPELVHAFVRCPRCGSPDFRVVRGRGVSIAGLA